MLKLFAVTLGGRAPGTTPPLQPVNGYHIIPDAVIRDYLAAHS